MTYGICADSMWGCEYTIFATLIVTMKIINLFTINYFPIFRLQTTLTTTIKQVFKQRFKLLVVI